MPIILKTHYAWQCGRHRHPQAALLLTAEVIPEADFREKGPASASGKIILTEEMPHKIKAEAVNAGAVGIISYFSRYAENHAETQWINIMADGRGWGLTAEDSQIWAFVISPDSGKELLEKCSTCGVTVNAEVDTCIYEGSFDLVTGIIEGSEYPDEEVWLIAHAYEPFPCDNACGVAAGIEIMQLIKEAIDKGVINRPLRTIRFITSWENFGFAWYAENIKPESVKAITAVNLDSLCCDSSKADITLEARLAPDALASFTNPLFQYLTENIIRDSGRKLNIVPNCCSDDTLLSTPLCGIPTQWLMQKEGRFWHNSSQTWDLVDIKLLESNIKINGAFVLETANMNESSAPEYLEIIKEITSEKLTDNKANKSYIEETAGRQIDSLLKICNYIIDNPFKNAGFHIDTSVQKNNCDSDLLNKYIETAKSIIPEIIVPGGAAIGFSRVP
ncbi:MAG: M28 family metallopeptidase, partial [Planctomycetota bacterium]